MAKLPVLTAKEGENLLLKNNFINIRSKGSHRIYERDEIKIVIPFHSNKTLHPKIVKQIMKVIN